MQKCIRQPQVADAGLRVRYHCWHSSARQEQGPGLTWLDNASEKPSAGQQCNGTHKVYRVLYSQRDLTCRQGSLR